MGHAIIAGRPQCARHATYRRRLHRPALCQRAAASRPSGRLHPGRHLGARAAHGRRHGALRLRRRHPRHADHAGAPRRRASRRKPSSPACRPGTSATSPSSASPSTTTTPPTPTHNRALTEAIYAKLDNNGHIGKRSIAQLYDPVKGMFLPDRYIKGICPNCGTPDQYGDNCENCGATYAPTDLKDPRSVVSGATPELRDSEHFFFEVGQFEDFLREWLAGDVADARRQGQADGMARRRGRPARLGHLARCAVLRLRDPRPSGQVLLRLAGRADRLPVEPAGPVRARRPELLRLHRPRQHGRAAPLHRQGHRQLPRPVLAGRAARRRLPRADAAARQRLPHRRRREDVEVARHLRHGAHLPRQRPADRKRCATTTRRSPPAASTTSTSTSRTSSRA